MDSMLEDLVFERAKDNSMITKHFESNSRAWAGPLSVGAYLDLQHKLADTAASKGKTAYWVLRKLDEPMGLISSCTTYMRDVIITKGKGTRTTKAIVITDIFTHPEYRMRGMAELLLKNLRDHMDQENFSNAEFSIVYGDLQSGLLTRLGWKPQPATQLRISVGQLDALERQHVKEARYLGFLQVVELVAKDVNTSKLRLSGHRDGAAHIQILPSGPLTRWHMIRSRLFSQHNSRGRGDMEVHGAISFAGPGRYAWAWWVHDYRARQLYVGRMYVSRRSGFETTVRRLLEAAVVEASVCGIRDVVIWDPSEQLAAAAGMLAGVFGEKLIVAREDRLEMVPWFRWKDGDEREVTMEEGEYYAWS